MKTKAVLTFKVYPCKSHGNDYWEVRVFKNRKDMKSVLRVQMELRLFLLILIMKNKEYAGKYVATIHGEIIDSAKKLPELLEKYGGKEDVYYYIIDNDRE